MRIHWLEEAHEVVAHVALRNDLNAPGVGCADGERRLAGLDQPEVPVARVTALVVLGGWDAVELLAEATVVGGADPGDHLVFCQGVACFRPPQRCGSCTAVRMDGGAGWRGGQEARYSGFERSTERAAWSTLPAW